MTVRPTDVVIFGGGVAGLWLLNRLTRAGVDALLIESGGLGGGQTRYSQGIIHGGTKYALTGQLTHSSEAIALMPTIWRHCLAGSGEIDLTAVRRLSEHQYLWSTASIASRLAGFFASHAMRARTAALNPEEYPPALRDGAFRGQVYRLDEPVLEVGSLIRALAGPVRERLLAARWPEGIRFTPGSDGHHVELFSDSGGSLVLEARRLVLAAGRGNAEILTALGRQRPEMQLRPLKMVLLKEAPADLYAHCLGASTTPRITVTTHFDSHGGRVWYLGGQLAEEAARGDDEQLAAARAELTALFPWFQLARHPLAVAPIDRAEPRMAGGRRPDDIFAEEEGGVITCWPTKLAFAPRLADQLLERLLPHVSGGLATPPAWPRPDYAPMPWEIASWS